MRLAPIATLAVALLVLTAGSAAAVPANGTDDGDAGPPDDLPDVVPDFVGDILGAINDFLAGVISGLGDVVSGLTPGGDGAPAGGS